MECYNSNLKKICSFYVSDWHLTTMLLPYVSKKAEEGSKIVPILENALEDNVQTLLSKINLNEESKSKIEKINWNSRQFNKYSEVEDLIENILKENKEIYFLVVGNQEYKQIVNENITNWANQNLVRMLKDKINMSLINCFEVSQFNTNMKEILDGHDKILNTSGEREIADVFEGYQKPEPITKAN